MLVRNKQLSAKQEQETTLYGQKCNAPGCRQCPLASLKERPIVNGIQLTIPKSLNCKSKNIICMWKESCAMRHILGGQYNTATIVLVGTGPVSTTKIRCISMHAKECHIKNFSLEAFL